MMAKVVIMMTRMIMTIVMVVMMMTRMIIGNAQEWVGEFVTLGSGEGSGSGDGSGSGEEPWDE